MCACVYLCVCVYNAFLIACCEPLEVVQIYKLPLNAFQSNLFRVRIRLLHSHSHSHLSSHSNSNSKSSSLHSAVQTIAQKKRQDLLAPCQIHLSTYICIYRYMHICMVIYMSYVCMDIYVHITKSKGS